MVVYAFLVSTSFPVGAAITDALDPVVLTFVRFVIAAALFGPLALIGERRAWPGPRDLGRYAVISASIVAFFVAMFEALRWTSAVSTGALFTLVPLISAGVALALLRQTTGWRQLALMALGGAGAVWIVFDGSLDRLLALEIGRGEVIFLLGCLAFGAYSPLVKWLHRGESVQDMAFWTIAVGAVALGLIGAPKIATTAWGAVPAGAYLGIVYLAVFSTGVTFLIAKYASVNLPPSKVMSYTYLTPVFILVIEFALGHGWPGASVTVGVVVTVAATLLLQRA